MIERRLTSDLIADTSLWRLYVRVSPDSLEALLLGPMSADRTVLAHVEPLADGSLKALENAIYDNPLLLGDFESVVLDLATSQWAESPAGVDDSLAERIAETMLPDCDGPRRPVRAPLPDGASLVALVDAETLNFLNRTFPDASLTLSMSAGARWLNYYNRNRGDSAHVYGLCRAGELQVFAFGPDGRLRFANCFDAASASDCAYFLLAAAGGSDAPMSVGGDPTLRNEVCDMLRMAAPGVTVLPLTLPDNLLSVRRQAPEITDDMLFLTEL